jgi:hypothetical protein
LPQLQRLLSKDIGAYSTVLSIYKDSAELLEQLDDVVFDELLTIIKTSKRARVVSLMEMTCVSDGCTVLKNQNRCVRVLLEEAPHLVWVLKSLDGHVWLSDPEGAFDPISITDLHHRFDETDLMTPASDLEERTLSGDALKASLYRYHAKMLELLHSVVQGRNDYALSIIEPLAKEKGLDFESLVTLVEATNIPWSMRTRCCKLLCAMYVDRDPFHQLLANIHTHVWSGLNQSSSNGVQGSVLGDAATQVRRLKAILVSLLHQDDVGNAEHNPARTLSGASVTASKTAKKLDRGVQLFQDEFRAEIIRTLSELLKLVFLCIE